MPGSGREGNQPIPPAEGFVLAGGQSSRMGSDKALALFAGIPLIRTALAILQGAALSARIVGSQSSLDAFAETVPDTFLSAGPLAGVHAGLAATTADWCVFLPVDMPLLPAALVRILLQRARLTGAPVTVARLNGRIEPFPAVLARQILPQVSLRLQSRNLGCQAAWRHIPPALGSQLDAVSVEHLVACGQLTHPAALPPTWWFQSANTPADLAWLNGLLHRFPGASEVNRVI